MKKRILTFFCVLALFVTLAIPAFADTFAVDISPGQILAVNSNQYDNVVATFNTAGGLTSSLAIDGPRRKLKITSISNSSSSCELGLFNAVDDIIASTLDGSLDVGLEYDGIYSIVLFPADSSVQQTVDISFDFLPYDFSVSPAFANPIQSGEYDVSGLFGSQADNWMYTVRDDPKIFTFTDVTANTLTVVSYAFEASAGVVTYHDIGTLTEGFTFSSADYPVASFFTVRNYGGSFVSYTVTVENDSFEKSQGIAKSIWQTCLEMGTSLINWLKTPANWIALIPLVMFLLVGAVLIIRKLIKGV